MNEKKFPVLIESGSIADNPTRSELTELNSLCNNLNLLDVGVHLQGFLCIIMACFLSTEIENQIYSWLLFCPYLLFIVIYFSYVNDIVSYRGPNMSCIPNLIDGTKEEEE